MLQNAVFKDPSSGFLKLEETISSDNGFWLYQIVPRFPLLLFSSQQRYLQLHKQADLQTLFPLRDDLLIQSLHPYHVPLDCIQIARNFGIVTGTNEFAARVSSAGNT